MPIESAYDSFNRSVLAKQHDLGNIPSHNRAALAVKPESPSKHIGRKNSRCWLKTSEGGHSYCL